MKIAKGVTWILPWLCHIATANGRVLLGGGAQTLLLELVEHLLLLLTAVRDGLLMQTEGGSVFRGCGGRQFCRGRIWLLLMPKAPRFGASELENRHPIAEIHCAG
jgi:hypothetical protein